ncbi:MAG: cyclic nucleotide-binding domain-containing protein, partial [Oscillospiraceae bacterium]|nr:cyclic nucleotide-binding domain-containing protein [Oscillospiraceae bacterium]
MEQFPLFRNITAEQWQDMQRCFGVVERSYRPDDVIYDFGDGGNRIGIVLSGSAVVERIDAQGNRAILEHLTPGGVFGEMLMFANVHGDSIR